MLLSFENLGTVVQLNNLLAIDYDIISRVLRAGEAYFCQLGSNLIICN